MNVIQQIKSRHFLQDLNQKFENKWQLNQHTSDASYFRYTNDNKILYNFTFDLDIHGYTHIEVFITTFNVSFTTLYIDSRETIFDVVDRCVKKADAIVIGLKMYQKRISHTFWLVQTLEKEEWND